MLLDSADQGACVDSDVYVQKFISNSRHDSPCTVPVTVPRIRLSGPSVRTHLRAFFLYLYLLAFDHAIWPPLQPCRRALPRLPRVTPLEYESEYHCSDSLLHLLVNTTSPPPPAPLASATERILDACRENRHSHTHTCTPLATQRSRKALAMHDHLRPYRLLGADEPWAPWPCTLLEILHS